MSGARLVGDGVALAVGGAALLWPAAYNGYPLLYPDSAIYLSDGVRVVHRLLGLAAGWPASSRPVQYGVAVFPFHWQASLWPVAAAQALVAAAVLLGLLRLAGLRAGWRARLAFLLAVAALTPLPWYVSYVMPDVFSGLMIAAWALLAPGGRGPLARWALLLLVVAAIMFHVSNLATACALLALSAGLGLARRVPWRGTAWLAAGVAAGLAGLLAYPAVTRGELSLAPAAAPWPLARLLAQGPAFDYLAGACATERFVLCGRLAAPPETPEAFLWGPTRKGPDQRRIDAESGRILAGTLMAYPGRVAAGAARDFALQLVTFASELFFQQPYADLLRAVSPRMAEDFAASREGRQELAVFSVQTNPLPRLDALHAAVVGLAAAGGLVAAAMLWRRREGGWLLALAFVAAGLAANAFACAVLSGVHDRYQGRVVWLLPVWTMLAGWKLAEARRARGARS